MYRIDRPHRRFRPAFDRMPGRIAPSSIGLPDPTDPVDPPSGGTPTLPMPDPTDPVDPPAPDYGPTTVTSSNQQ